MTLIWVATMCLGTNALHDQDPNPKKFSLIELKTTLSRIKVERQTFVSFTIFLYLSLLLPVHGIPDHNGCFGAS